MARYFGNDRPSFDVPAVVTDIWVDDFERSGKIGLQQFAGRVVQDHSLKPARSGVGYLGYEEAMTTELQIALSRLSPRATKFLGISYEVEPDEHTGLVVLATAPKTFLSERERDAYEANIVPRIYHLHDNVRASVVSWAESGCPDLKATHQ